jgi:alpha-glucosidase (family GH31 glycosyl hydrolase)
MDKYMQVDFRLPSQRIFGLGERNREFALTEGAWTMWANGQENPYDDGLGMKQTYGVHPFALVQASENKNEFVGVWFRNTNAQSPIVQYNTTDGSALLRYITTGGKIHAYFFMQGTAKEIISRYMTVIGKPRMPPFWSMGWGAGSRGYDTLAEYTAMVENYTTAGVPLDGIFLDMQYMNAG